jgi:hypothetical protein
MKTTTHTAIVSLALIATLFAPWQVLCAQRLERLPPKIDGRIRTILRSSTPSTSNLTVTGTTACEEHMVVLNSNRPAQATLDVDYRSEAAQFRADGEISTPPGRMIVIPVPRGGTGR